MCTGCLSILTTNAKASNVFQGTNAIQAYEGGMYQGSCSGVGPISYDDPAVARVYLDRYGDVFPGPGIGTGIPDATARNFSESLMENYAFRASPTEQQASTSAWYAVLKDIGMLQEVSQASASRPNSKAGSDASRDIALQRVGKEWQAIQSALRTNLATYIAGVIEETDAEQLAVFIHGFNTTDPECSYARMRQTVEQEAPSVRGKTAYLYVTWDGLESFNKAGALNIWKKAQYNFPMVGMGLRQLLAAPQIPRDVDVRVLTHSSGGPVAAHTFWNAASVLPGNPADYSGVISEIGLDREPPVPVFDDIRIGMIVPATGWLVFNNYSEGPTEHIRRISLGLNPSDFAVTKAQASCASGGTTCLASRPADACWVPKHIKGKSRTEVHGYDLRGYRGEGYDGEGWKTLSLWKVYEIHNLETYLVREGVDDIIRSVFTDDDVPDDWESYCKDVGAP